MSWRLFEAINANDLDSYRELVAPGFAHHSGAGDLTADAAIKAFAGYQRAFPDIAYDIDEILPVDGGAAVARWTIRGTHTGVFMGVPPSGRTFASPGLSLHKVADGRIVEEWEYNDDLTLLGSLGFSVAPPGSADT
jgi:steroid delta-isomerase-like uncharacterized protein